MLTDAWIPIRIWVTGTTVNLDVPPHPKGKWDINIVDTRWAQTCSQMGTLAENLTPRCLPPYPIGGVGGRHNATVDVLLATENICHINISAFRMAQHPPIRPLNSPGNSCRLLSNSVQKTCTVQQLAIIHNATYRNWLLLLGSTCMQSSAFERLLHDANICFFLLKGSTMLLVACYLRREDYAHVSNERWHNMVNVTRRIYEMRTSI